MEKTEFFDFADDFFMDCLEILSNKNEDYSSSDESGSDPFLNFKSVEAYGIDVEQGFLTRMSDKMSRIASFIRNGELHVKDESVTDTLQDLANYSCLLAGYIESKKERSTLGTRYINASLGSAFPSSVLGDWNCEPLNISSKKKSKKKKKK